MHIDGSYRFLFVNLLYQKSHLTDGYEKIAKNVKYYCYFTVTNAISTVQILFKVCKLRTI